MITVVKQSNEQLIKGIEGADPRAISRLITLIENRVPRARDIQARIYAKTGRAQIVGVTGPPGAGKSTLVDQLALIWRAKGKKVAILAVDPSSPFSGGAVLGDRVRMVRAAEDSSVFIRSMASRGSLGGLARATLEAIDVLDASGFDIILVETVGVGQAEVDIVKAADTCLVVLVPGMGDSVQAIKAGILEIADLYIINKADREGSDALQRDLRLLLSLVEHNKQDWEPPILKTVATNAEGIADVVENTEKHNLWSKSSGAWKERKLKVIEEIILKLINEMTIEQLLQKKASELKKLVAECFSRKIDPFSAAEKIGKIGDTPLL